MDTKLIGNIEFQGLKINIFYSSCQDENKILCMKQARNPDSFYQGCIVLNHKTGKIEYPEGAVIPKQTDHDTEIIPKAIVTGQKELSNKLICKIREFLNREFFIEK